MVSLDGGSAGKVDDVIPSRAAQDGGYALPWQRYDNNKMAAIYFLHLQQYRHILNLFYFFVNWPVSAGCSCMSLYIELNCRNKNYVLK